jgi:hypothetical protein
MIVTTAMTAVTPTTIPISVSAVRSLLARRLEVATRKASQSEARRINFSERAFGGNAFTPFERRPVMWLVLYRLSSSATRRAACLSYFFVFLD